MKNYPSQICDDCGNKYGKIAVGTSTFHIGKCQVCGEKKAVTESRDWGYPDIPGFKHYERENNPLLDI